ncbi:cytochrome c maturation protein CcmE [Hoeflea prorocentri]|uniref:Cytochrome c-type biogenesis protein CcmE n=1 Tax=Hoeflea prorocentri TaxID=1922333 RepID=A0A9X3UIK2_9HYPH|nr:cytochrome c maturation protein CcmE [Hoeflea prorocentri]MCY6381503.1 cytochrome c maturation protein CcmE [Hoeflea prorocentri]MDA5399303.1 cytochrome c maturation protein CcmE [Hoeflea prorocentri]
MTRKQKRLSIIAAGVGVIGAAVLLVLFALQEQIVYFHSPTDVAEKTVEPGTRIRLGGLVAEASVQRGQGTYVEFAVTDTANTVPITYNGILPDLFREGQGVVVEGAFQSGNPTFVADTVLAKHDETYMPKEVAESLKAQGVWKGEGE